MADKFEQIDLKDKEGIEALARSLQNSSGLAGIMTAGTDFSATVAWAAERLGLPGIPYEAALYASDKARMRACFKKAGLPSPEFIAITGAESHEKPPMPFPLVVKPVDNMGGRGCCRVNILEEYREAVMEAIRFSRSGRAIVEAFMDGPEFSVDAIVYHGEITICGLADRHIFYPPYFIEMGHTMPTSITPEQQKALLETFCAGVRALGLAGDKSIGAAKGDIKLTSSGPMIGEIAARLSGGYMSGWTYPYSSGVEPIRAAIFGAIGRKPDCLVPLKTWTSVERAFISIPGTVKSISGTSAAQNRPFVKDVFLRIACGTKVDFPRNNVSKCGNIISAAPDRASAVEAAESAVRSILIRLDPDDPVTGDFLLKTGTGDRGLGTGECGRRGCTALSGVFRFMRLCGSPRKYPSLQKRREGFSLSGGRIAGFPPDAYQLDSELRATLNTLPDTTIQGQDPTGQSLQIYPFPAFQSSGLKDYAGREVEEALEAVRELTGLKLPEFNAKNAVKTPESSDNKRNNFLGRQFWAVLARGGYQGAVYYIERGLGTGDWGLGIEDQITESK
jgi:biotin carboxylase